jgi:hypothetical protein
MKSIKTREATPVQLNYLVAICENYQSRALWLLQKEGYVAWQDYENAWGNPIPAYSTCPALAHLIIDRESISIIRANDVYKTDKEGFTTRKHIPQWFAQKSKYAGNDIQTSYESEHFEPCFMINEDEGVYGPEPLTAAMRAYVYHKLGETAKVPEELL